MRLSRRHELLRICASVPHEIGPREDHRHRHDPTPVLEAFWTIPGMTVADAANWLIAHPTADLITTASGPVPDEDYDTANVGYIPEEGAQEGIVYTVATMADGVAVRAQIAALAEGAVCPTLPDGGMMGAPGQG